MGPGFRRGSGYTKYGLFFHTRSAGEGLQGIQLESSSPAVRERRDQAQGAWWARVGRGFRTPHPNHSLVPTFARVSAFCLAASRAAAGSGLARTLVSVLRPPG